MNDVVANLSDIRAQIAAAAHSVGRDAADVTLVAVSKTQPAPVIRAALNAGQRVFGENRVQEAAGKWPELRTEFSDIELHLIGPLQSNKTAQAVALFDVIQTLDRPKLAESLAAEIRRQGRTPGLMIQVNTGLEPQKAGIAPADVGDFLALCRDQYGLNITGLMAIPPVDEEPSLHFALLADLAHRHGLSQLSMGMSSDFAAAIAFNATHVRVGTALFGARQTDNAAPG